MNSTNVEETMNASGKPWRVRDGRLVLLAYRHADRDELYFPPLPETSPQRARTELVDLQGVPTLYSYTVIYPSPKTGKPPMAIGYADYPEGVRIFGRLLYPAARRPVIGDTLSPCLVETEDGTVYAFEPQNEEPRA